MLLKYHLTLLSLLIIGTEGQRELDSKPASNLLFKFLGKKDLGTTHLHIVSPLDFNGLIEQTYHHRTTIEEWMVRLEDMQGLSSEGKRTVKTMSNGLIVFHQKLTKRLAKLNETLSVVSLPGESENPVQQQIRQRRDLSQHPHDFNQGKLSNTSLERPKRQFGLIFGLIGLGNSVYNSFQVKTIQDRLDNLGARQDVIVNQVELHQKVINELRLDVSEMKKTTGELVRQLSRAKSVTLYQTIVTQIEIATTAVIEQIDNAIIALHQLIRNTLHPTFVDLETLSAELQRLDKHLNTLNMKLFDPRPSSVYHYPLSVYRLGNEVRYIIHIPISTHLEQLNVFEFIPTPFHLGNFSATIETDKPILLLDDHGTFGTQVSKEFLSSCIRTMESFHCTGASLYSKDIEHLCLARLYLHQLDGIDKVCDVKLSKRKEIVQQISSNTFRVLSDTPQTITTRCKAGLSSYPRQFTVNGNQTVSLNQTCRIASKSYVFTTSVDLLHERHALDMEVDILQPLNLDFLHEFEEQELMTVFNLTRTTPTALVPLKEFREKLEERRNGSWTNWFRLIAELTVVAVLTLVLLYLFIKCGCQCRRSCKSRQACEQEEDEPPNKAITWAVPIDSRRQWTPQEAFRRPN